MFFIFTYPRSQPSPAHSLQVDAEGEAKNVPFTNSQKQRRQEPPSDERNMVSMALAIYAERTGQPPQVKPEAGPHG